MSEELQELLLKAMYAGHKYWMAVDAAVDSYETGHVDTPGNAGLVSKYRAEWRAYTERALELHAKETGN